MALQHLVITPLTSQLMNFALGADTCGDVMVNALHRDGGIGDGVALQVTHEALDATVNLQNKKSKIGWGKIEAWFEERVEFGDGRSSLNGKYTKIQNGDCGSLT